MPDCEAGTAGGDNVNQGGRLIFEQLPDSDLGPIEPVFGKPTGEGMGLDDLAEIDFGFDW